MFQYKQKINLLHANYTFTCFAFDVFKFYLPFKPSCRLQIPLITDYLTELKDALIVIRSINFNQSESLDKNLTELLQVTYSKRISIWDNLLRVLHAAQIPDLAATEGLLMDANVGLDRITDIIYQRGFPIHDFEQSLNTTKGRIRNIVTSVQQSQLWQETLLPKTLKSFFGSFYQEAYTQQKRTLFLANWLNILNKKIERMRQKFSPQSVDFALRAKHILYNAKQKHYLSLHQQLKKPLKVIYESLLQIILSTHEHENEVTAIKVINRLCQQQDEYRDYINVLEMGLNNRTGYESLSSGIRIWTENYYYQLAKNYFKFMQKLSDDETLCDYPLLDTKFTPGYLKLSTNLAACIAIGMDAYWSSWRVVPYHTFNTLSNLLLLDLEGLIEIGKDLHLEQETIMDNFSAIRWVLGLGLHIVFYTAIFGFSFGNVAYLFMSYLAADACRNLSNYLLEKLRTQPTTQQNSTTRAWNLFVRTPIAHISSLVGYSYLGPKLANSAATFFKPMPPTTKLFDLTPYLPKLEQQRLEL